MTLSIASLVANDAIVKLASESMPPSQLIFLRGLFATALLLALGLILRLPFRAHVLADRRVLVRAVLDTLATASYMTAIAHVQLANATAINMTTPIIATLLATLMFREEVSERRWVAIVVGFAGVLLVVQPAGDTFNAWTIPMVACAVLTALRDLTTRSFKSNIPSLQITLTSTIASLIFSAVWGIVQDWQPLGARESGLIFSAGVLVSCGHFLMIVAIREGEISVIAPFRYLGLIFSAGLGYAIWGHTPNSLALFGMALIVIAGLPVIRGK